MLLYFDEEEEIEEAIREAMQEAAVLCAKEEDLDEERLSVSISFVDEEEIQRLNREYRQKDSVTDVLSFPQFDGIQYLTDFQEISLGDVVICRSVAQKQAREYGHSTEREYLYLFTHSVFHLLGYDHMNEDEKIIMREKEERVMAGLSLPRNSIGGDILE